MADIQKLFKDSLTVIKEQTVMDLLENDANYQQSVKEHAIAEEKYESIKHTFSNEQQLVIDELLTALDANNTDINDLLYMAGLRDMYRLLNSYGLLNDSLPS